MLRHPERLTDTLHHLSQQSKGCQTLPLANPVVDPFIIITKVVTMLQNIQKKVEAESDKEEQLFKKYMCYCSTAGGDLQKSISASTTKVPQLQSDIEAAEAQKVQLKEDLAKHQADRTAAKAAMADATAIREKEAAAFSDLKAESSSNIAAITKAWLGSQSNHGAG